MTRDELIEKMARAICCVNGCLYPRACDMEMNTAQERLHEASAALAVIVEWLEGEATQANELINNPHRNQDFTTNIGLAATAREILRLIAMLKEPTT